MVDAWMENICNFLCTKFYILFGEIFGVKTKNNLK